MANHKSAQKRSRQTTKKTIVNKKVLGQIKTTYNKIISNTNVKNTDTHVESLRLYNIILSKAVKKGLIKKRTASRKLSSLSDKLIHTT